LPAAATTTQTVAIHLKFSNYFDYMRQPPAKSSTGAAALVKIAFAQPPSWLAGLTAPVVVPPPAGDPWQQFNISPLFHEKVAG
jgi:hypothetical protein